jgi:ABC-type Fe3+-hydroxamate transport system substrate-binding protein
MRDSKFARAAIATCLLVPAALAVTATAAPALASTAPLAITTTTPLTATAGSAFTVSVTDSENPPVTVTQAESITVTGGVTGGTFPVGGGPDAIAFDGTNMWVANGGNTVTELPPAG